LFGDCKEGYGDLREAQGFSDRVRRMCTVIVLFSASEGGNVAAIPKVCGFLASSMNFLIVCL
jgi:hypothetical protein